MKQFCIQENDSGQRLDRFLQKILPELPKSLSTNGFAPNTSRSTKSAAHRISGWRWAMLSHCLSATPISKPVRSPGQKPRIFAGAGKAGHPVRERAGTPGVQAGRAGGTPDNRQTPDTLINRILHYLYDTGAYRPAQEQSFTPALRNRLDRNTGGIVIAIKLPQHCGRSTVSFGKTASARPTSV